MSSFRCCCRPLNSVVVLCMFARLSSRMKLEKSPLIFIESLACTERPVPSSARTSCSLRMYGVPSGSWPLSALLDAAPQRHARAALGLDARLLRLRTLLAPPSSSMVSPVCVCSTCGGSLPEPTCLDCCASDGFVLACTHSFDFGTKQV